MPRIKKLANDSAPKKEKAPKIAKPLKLPKLPRLLERKVYKTGQTRGADDDEVYQNRVSRTNTVLIPYALWERCKEPAEGKAYAKGSVVLIDPVTYFGDPNIETALLEQGLELSKNAVVFYEKREDWIAHNPERLGWTSANKRGSNLGGKYVARISANTGQDGDKIARGFTTTKNKGLESESMSMLTPRPFPLVQHSSRVSFGCALTPSMERWPAGCQKRMRCCARLPQLRDATIRDYWIFRGSKLRGC